MSVFTIGVPVWLTLILLVAAFFAGAGVYRNNAKKATQAIADLEALKAKAASIGVKIALVLGVLSLLTPRHAAAQTRQTITIPAGDTVVVIGAPAVVVATPPATPSASFHEPAGYVTQINTGAITTPPSCSSAQSSWMLGGKAWTMFSSNVTSSVGENCANLQLASGHSGYRVYYPANVSPGASPARFGAAFANVGTGNLYVRFLAQLESGWTTNGNPGVKAMEPRTPQQGTGSTQQNDVIGWASSNFGTDGWAVAFSQGSSFANYPPFGYTAPYTPQGFYKDSAANLGAQHRGAWHRVEWLFQVNSPLGSANGCATLWIDSALEWNQCNVNWFVAGNTPAWNYLMFDPTYGGVKASPPAGGVAWDFDSLYVSVK